tara:strand:+ start:3629 stop:4081 length:453 start_codon:yes stop_codon:yes gene_type:complete
MASDQLTGAEIRIYAVDPAGNRRRLFQGVNEQTGPGGSPDGAQATVKANELPFMPVHPFKLKGGDILLMVGVMKTADGADASDSVMNVPIRRNGALEYLSVADLGYTTDLPASSVVDVEHQLGAGYTVPEGDVVQLGGGTYFISWEDDAA